MYVELDTIGLPSGVVQRITFEEQVTDINHNRLQDGRQVTLLDGPCNDVDHLVSNLCHSRWIGKGGFNVQCSSTKLVLL